MSQPIQAASVLLTRGTESLEIFVVRRSPALEFFGGFVAFPGGKLSESDYDIAVEDLPSPNGVGMAAERYVAAARELFEETGVLLCRGHGNGRLNQAIVDGHRRRLLAGQTTFAAILKDLGASISAADFELLGCLVTPPFVPQRFDSAFFRCKLPADQSAMVWPGELDEGIWSTAAEALRRWASGDWGVSPPTVTILEACLSDDPAAARQRLAEVAGLPIPPIYLAPAVRLIPQRTLALAPSTHTNVYLVGRDPAYLIDPGSPFPEEQSSLNHILDEEIARGLRLKAIILSHDHPDHVGGAVACAERYGLPIHAHPLTDKKLAGRIPVQAHIQDADHLDLGGAPDDGSPWYLEAVHTPGHAIGHLAFYDPHYRLLFAGDMVSTMSSVIIAPPDGDLVVYLQSLERIKRLNARLLLPSHGGPSARPAKTLDDCRDHRRRREQQLLNVLEMEGGSVPYLTQALYRGLDPALRKFAELQIEAGIRKLAGEGRIVSTVRDGQEVWSMAPADARPGLAKVESSDSPRE